MLRVVGGMGYGIHMMQKGDVFPSHVYSPLHTLKRQGFYCIMSCNVYPHLWPCICPS